MKRILFCIIMVWCCITTMAQGWPSRYGGVMLQGFYWDSFVESQWSNLEAQSDELSQYFDLVWVPQSGYCNSSYNNMGYAPVYWFNQNSSFGTEQQLRSFITTCSQKGMGVMADVVINHRGSVGVDGSWVDFPAETYKGTTYQLGLADICVDDDGGATAKRYAVTGAKDSGEDWNGMRDLDHSSANVQSNVLAYLGFLKDDLGYCGFRYDMTKGYAATYTGLYNSKINPEFSVGEYWDGNVTLLKNWLEATRKDGVIQSATFDYATRYAVRDACAADRWSALSASALANDDSYKRYAVTFVENHDTQYRSASEPGDPVKNYLQAANAYILTMPGTPCVFLQHWKTYKKDIKQLVMLRKLAGVHNQSATKTLNNTASQYVVQVEGTQANLIFAAGSSAYTPPAGYQQVASGSRYAVCMSSSAEMPWVDVPSGTYTVAFDVAFTAVSADASARLVYTTDGSEPTASSASLASGATMKVDGSMMLKVGLLSGGKVGKVISRQYTIEQFKPYQATVYVKDPKWSSVYLYSWANDGKNTQLNGAWPGKVMTQTATIDGEKWYCHTFDVTGADYSFNVIFNTGSNTGQTVDIGPIAQDRYYVLSTTMTNGKYTVTDVTATAGIEPPVTEQMQADGVLKVYGIAGTKVREVHGASNIMDALNGLPHGIYVVNGKKVCR